MRKKKEYGCYKVFEGKPTEDQILTAKEELAEHVKRVILRCSHFIEKGPITPGDPLGSEYVRKHTIGLKIALYIEDPYEGPRRMPKEGEKLYGIDGEEYKEKQVDPEAKRFFLIDVAGNVICQCGMDAIGDMVFFCPEDAEPIRCYRAEIGELTTML